jgi:hypothetical protein
MLSKLLSLSAFVLASAAATTALAQQPAYGEQPQPQDNFQAGGMRPPTAMPGDPYQPQPTHQTDTERRLAESEKADAGRGLEWVYFNVQGGYQYLGLETLKSDGLTYGDTVNPTAGGPMIGAAAGIRLVLYTLGVHARLGLFEHFNLATLNGEAGVRIPLGSLEPYFHFGGGYAFLSALDTNDWGGKPTPRGWNARLGAGIDYYVTSTFSVGANITGDALFLSRSGVEVADGTPLDAASRKVAEADGSGVGASITTSALLGLHF